MLKFFKRLFLSIFILIIVLVAAFIGAAYYDEPLVEGYEDFFHADVAPDAENGQVELMGIVAPKGEDPRAFAQTFIDRMRREIAEATPDNPFDAEDGGDYEIADLEALDDANITCWIQAERYGQPDEDCLSLEQLTALISQYQFLLDRLYKLDRYQKFDTPKGMGVSGLKKSGQTRISLFQLELARITLLLQNGHYDEAVESWERLLRLSRKMISGYHDWVGQAVDVVNFGMMVRYSSLLVDLLPTDARHRYHDRIQKDLSLTVVGKDGWDVHKTLVAEHYSLIGNFYDWLVQNPDETEGSFVVKYVSQLGRRYVYKQNMSNNLYYRYAQDITALSCQPLSKYGEDIALVQKKYQGNIELDESALLGPNGAMNIMFPALTKGTEIVTNACLRQADLDLMKIYINAKTQQVSLAEMKEFVENNQADKFYPDLSYHWDSEKNMIYFDVSFGDYPRREIFYKP